MQSEEEPKLLTTREAAERLHVHENTLRKWADEGKVPAVRIPGAGTHRRFQVHVIDEVRQAMGFRD